MSRQLALDLPAREAFGRGDWFTTPATALALATVDGWRGWPQGRMLLTGPAGAGKTHLAHLWAEEAGARVIAASDLTEAALPGLAAGPLALDDAQGVAGAGEAALFHLLNLQAAQGHALLLTAPTPPRDWGLALPDLISRLQAVSITPLPAPDDALLSAVLVKLFADRQLAVSPQLIAWLVARIERSVGAARDAVARLDAASLARGGPVSRALAAEVLDLDAPE